MWPLKRISEDFNNYVCLMQYSNQAANLEKGSKKVEQRERETETGRDREKQGDKERETRSTIDIGRERESDNLKQIHFTFL